MAAQVQLAGRHWSILFPPRARAVFFRWLYVRQTIKSLEDTLDPKEFLRIHRSILVRKAAVRGLHPLFHGDYIVKLTNGAELTLSRNFHGSFFNQMSR